MLLPAGLLWCRSAPPLLGGAYLLGPQVSVLGLLLEEVSAVHRVVLLQLHRLHLLLDGLHGCGCEGVGCSELSVEQRVNGQVRRVGL